MRVTHLVVQYVRYDAPKMGPGSILQELGGTNGKVSTTTQCGRPVVRYPSPSGSGHVLFILHRLLDDTMWNGAQRAEISAVTCRSCKRTLEADGRVPRDYLPLLFRDVRAYRCLRILMTRGAMLQAEFMRLYAAIGKYPQRDSSHFDRFWSHGKPIKRTRNATKVRGIYQLTWTGPTCEQYLTSLTNEQLDEAFVFTEQSMTGFTQHREFASESVDEAVEWMKLIQAEQQARSAITQNEQGEKQWQRSSYPST